MRLAGLRITLWAVKPIYYLRTHVWLDGKKANALVAIEGIGVRPILFISGDKDEICPTQTAKRMFDAARSPDKLLLVVPGAEHDTTFSTNPQIYESAVEGFLEKSFSAGR